MYYYLVMAKMCCTSYFVFIFQDIYIYIYSNKLFKFSIENHVYEDCATLQGVGGYTYL